MSDRNEWLQWRHKGFGSSDAPAIHGVSPYLTFYELIETKIADTYVEKTDNSFITDRGNEIEGKARVKFAALFNMENGTDEDFAPRRIEMADLPFMKATLDGSSKCGALIIEIKFMSKPVEHGQKELTEGQEKHLNVKDAKLPITAKDGPCRVPHHYWIQVQHQLLVSGAKSCAFVSDDGVTQNSCIVEPDVAFMKLHLSKCVEAWQLVQAKKLPEPGPEDYKELRVKGAKAKVQKWKRLKALVAEYEAQIEDLRSELIEMCSHPRMRCDGVRFVRTAGRKGNIEYARLLAHPKIMKVMTEEKLDPENFRGKASAPSWKMELEK